MTYLDKIKLNYLYDAECEFEISAVALLVTPGVDSCRASCVCGLRGSVEPNGIDIPHTYCYVSRTDVPVRVLSRCETVLSFLDPCTVRLFVLETAVSGQPACF